MHDLASLIRRDAIGIITINNPPVNALSPAVAQRMLSCVCEAQADSSIRAIVLIGAGSKRSGKPGSSSIENGLPVTAVARALRSGLPKRPKPGISSGSEVPA
jgi:3-hydroxyacyl-CoA dehydrogenase